MANIGSLVIDLLLNTAKFETDMGRSAKQTEKHARKIQAQWEELGSKVGKAALAAATAITVLVVKATLAANELVKAASKSGIAVRSFSELAYAAKTVDVDVGALSAALKAMQLALSGAATGNKEANTALKALGLTISDLQGLAPDRQFEILADRISQLKDPADRTRASVEFFGRAGGNLLPLFEQGAQGIQALRKEAVTLNRVLDESGAKQIQAAESALSRMKAAGEGLAQTLAIRLAPAIIRVADALRQLAGGRNELDVLNQLKGRRESILEGVGGDLSRFPSGGRELKQLQELEAEIAELERKARLRRPPVTHNRGATLTGGKGEAPGFNEIDAAQKAAEAQAKLNEKLAENVADMQAEIAREVARLGEASSKAFGDLLNENADALREQEEQQREYVRAISNFYRDLDKETQTSAERQADAIKEFQQKIDLLVASGDLSPERAQKRAEEFKKQFDTMSIYADQAARNMQDAFAQFLFDPFNEGLKGMLRSFIDILRRMVAEAGAARIFETLFGKNGAGAGGLLGGFLGGILGSAGKGSYSPGIGLATGTNYVPSDNFPAMLHKGEAVVPAAYNPAAGGIGGAITINNNIDARGATVDAIAALPEVLRRNNESVKADIIDGLRRRRFAV